MSRAVPLILLSAVVLLSSTANAANGSFNITRYLERTPEFSQFNELLTRTKLADEINHRLTITVLAVNNDNIGAISGKPEDVQKRILSNHVILDYYDQAKLKLVKENKTTLTTLYQASGTADERQGFLKVENKDGSIVFGSDVKGAPADSKYVSSLGAFPYNFSVIAISQPIIAPGIDGALPPSSKAPTSAPPPPKATAPVPSTTTSQAPTTSTTTSQAPTPSDAASPPPADTPAADATTSPPPANAAGKISGVSFGFGVAIASLLAAF